MYIYIYIYKERLFGTETCAAWETLYNWMHTWIYIRIYIYIYIYKERLFGTETCAAWETFCHVSAPHEKKKGFFQRVSLTRFSLCQRDSFKETLFERYTETCGARENLWHVSAPQEQKESFWKSPFDTFQCHTFQSLFQKEKTLWKSCSKSLFQRVPLTSLKETLRTTLSKSPFDTFQCHTFQSLFQKESFKKSLWKSCSKSLFERRVSLKESF